MTQGTAQVLSSLRDLTGVQGSFMVSGDGELVAEDMGALFNDELLAEVAPRVVRLCDTFTGEQGSLTSCSIRFADTLLFIRPLPGAVLCVLSTLDVKMPALKMGVNLILRRLSPPPAPAPSPPPLPESRRFRGQ
jgi:predicted regulator of Ras-like GTPase activity (Roadblock/LC7/MglB family)